jgi:hypothetical protein
MKNILPVVLMMSLFVNKSYTQELNDSQEEKKLVSEKLSEAVLSLIDADAEIIKLGKEKEYPINEFTSSAMKMLGLCGLVDEENFEKTNKAINKARKPSSEIEGQGNPTDLINIINDVLENNNDDKCQRSINALIAEHDKVA